MVDAIATILTGAGASVMTEGRDDDEWRKRVTAKLRQSSDHPPDRQPAAQARQLRRRRGAHRALLGGPHPRPVRDGAAADPLPLDRHRQQPEFSNEMARRLVRIRLDANVERPWQRSDFRHPDPDDLGARAPGWSTPHALPGVDRRGRPRGTRTIGSYENWAQVLGGVLEVAGIDGFLGNGPR